MGFKKIHDKRRCFVEINNNEDHVICDGTNNILISAPHGVSQLRLGKSKFAEPGSLATALYIKDKTKCYFIAKTRNNNDDANFDEESKYKDSIKKLIKDENIKYIIDFHGLAEKRGCDINLGTHIGHNIRNNEGVFDSLYKKLVDEFFVVFIDRPYMAGGKTISGYFANSFDDIWTIQIEINCGITNKKENYKRYKQLLGILVDWINEIDIKEKKSNS